MSTATAEQSEESAGLFDLDSVEPFRVLALVGILGLTATYVWKLHGITQVVKGSDLLFLSVVAASLVTATVFARYVSGKVAALIAAVLVVVGYAYYLLVVPNGFTLLFERFHQILADVAALLTGLPVLRIARADIWALGFVPGPVFLSWYLAVRRNYVAASTVGGLALLVLVLTHSLQALPTLAGVLCGVAAVGFGELDRRGGTVLQADMVIVVVALIAVVGGATPLVVFGDASPLDLGFGSGGTVEGTFVGSPGEMQITGPVELSPTVRYTVDADKERYWRTGVYDRFSGGGWTRTGQARAYREQLLDDPPGDRRVVVQTYTAESSVKTMPAAAEPVEVIGEATRNAQVTEHDTLRPDSSFIKGDRYRVRSLVLNASPEELRAAETEYPDRISERYLQVPGSISERFRSKTAQITAEADNPYDTAKAIEKHLERTKNYSLDVQKPTGNVANKFLLEMDRGYCTYYATTMTMMLRSEGVPARVAVGYTSGQQVADDEWVLRGLDSHVWVEAYFPEHGWVKFDPTPATPRRAAENQRVQEARQGGDAGGPVDTDASEAVPVTTTTSVRAPNGTTNNTTGSGPITLPGTRSLQPTVPSNLQGTTAPSGGGSPGSEGGGPGGLPSLPSGRDAAIGSVLILGLAAGAHRIGLGDRAYRAARLRWQGSRESPVEDVDRAYERLELLLASDYRKRQPGETHRDYVQALSLEGLDDRAQRVADIYERARYAEDVDRERADEAVELVDEMVRERTPVVGPIRRGRRRRRETSGVTDSREQ